MRRLLWPAVASLVGVLSLACGSGEPPDPEAIRGVVLALDGASPESTGRLLIAGLAAPETRLVPADCSEALDAVASASPDARSTLLTSALFEVCPRPCDLADEDVIAMGQMERRDQTKRLVELCMPSGPDPFGGNLAEKRAQMPALEYLAARWLVDRALAALEEDPALQADLRALLPAAAVGLAQVEVDPAAWPEDPIDADPGPGLNVTEVERKLRLLIPAIRQCQSAGGDPRPSDQPPGRAVLSLLVDDDGRVRRTVVALSSLSEAQEDCLLALMRGQDLPTPVDGPAVVDLYVDLNR